MRIEWAHALSCMALLLIFALALSWLRLAPLPLWAGMLLAIPTGLFVWVGPMFFWNAVYRRMDWVVPSGDKNED